MVRKLGLLAICVVLFCTSAMAQDAKTIIANAQTALGQNLNSITYSGSAKNVAFQQCQSVQCQGTHDPMMAITNYVRVIDLAAPTSRHAGATMNPPGGGAAGGPAAGTFYQAVTPQQADLSQGWANQLELWITPWGFLKGAAANNPIASVRRINGKTYNVLTWSPTVKALSGASYYINGWINDQNLVERVETWLGENIMGDMHILATYTDWKDLGGVKAPSKIVQTRGGWPFFEVTVTAAKANPPDLASIAPAPAGRGAGPGPAPAGAPAGGQRGPAPAGGGQRGAVPPAPGAPAGGGQRGAPAPAAAAAPAGGGQRGPAAPAAATSEKLAEGVYRITGGYVSLAVEFSDYIMLLEGGNSEDRALAIIKEAKRLIPNKPIRYVMNTHPHADHTGGLPAMVAEGVTIVTHNNNKEFLDTALNTPRTLLNDGLAKTPKKAKVEGVGEKKIYSDGTRTVEMYHMWPIPHSNGMLLAFLPKEKIIFQGDFSLPAAGQETNAHIKAMVPILDRLGLDYERYYAVHAPTPDVLQTKADVLKAVGR